MFNGFVAYSEINYNENNFNKNLLNDSLIAEYDIIFYNIFFNFTKYNVEEGNVSYFILFLNKSKIKIYNSSNSLYYIFSMEGTVLDNNNTYSFTFNYSTRAEIKYIGNLPVHYNSNGSVIGIPIYYVGPIIGDYRFKPVFGFIKPSFATFCLCRFNLSKYIADPYIEVNKVENGTYTAEYPGGVTVQIDVGQETNESYYVVSPCVPLSALSLLFPPEQLSPIAAIPDDTGLIKDYNFVLIWNNGDGFVYVRDVVIISYYTDPHNYSWNKLIIEHPVLLLELMKSNIINFNLTYTPEGYLHEGVIEAPGSLSHLLASLLLFPFFTTPSAIQVNDTVYDIFYQFNSYEGVSRAVISGKIYINDNYIVNIGEKIDETEGTMDFKLLIIIVIVTIVIVVGFVRGRRQ